MEVFKGSSGRLLRRQRLLCDGAVIWPRLVGTWVAGMEVAGSVGSQVLGML